MSDIGLQGDISESGVSCRVAKTTPYWCDSSHLSVGVCNTFDKHNLIVYEPINNNFLINGVSSYMTLTDECRVCLGWNERPVHCGLACNYVVLYTQFKCYIMQLHYMCKIWGNVYFSAYLFSEQRLSFWLHEMRRFDCDSSLYPNELVVWWR